MNLYAKSGLVEPIGAVSETDSGFEAVPFGAPSLGTFETNEEAEIALVQDYGAFEFWRENSGPFAVK